VKRRSYLGCLFDQGGELGADAPLRVLDRAFVLDQGVNGPRSRAIFSPELDGVRRRAVYQLR
jgi:hypothetical protein